MASPTIEELEQQARADYRAAGRHHHDERHLDDCLAKLADVAGLSDLDRRLLRWAIVWHDVIYDARRSDNEQQSAERASRELTEAGVCPADTKEVARLIHLTKGHEVAENDRLGAILVSIDLSILGAPSTGYARYAADVRKEYGHVSDEGWAAGRSSVLRRFLDSEVIFPDSAFRARFEAQARVNLADELRYLSEG